MEIDNMGKIWCSYPPKGTVWSQPGEKYRSRYGLGMRTRFHDTLKSIQMDVNPILCTHVYVQTHHAFTNLCCDPAPSRHHGGLNSQSPHVLFTSNSVHFTARTGYSLLQTHVNLTEVSIPGLRMYLFISSSVHCTACHRVFPPAIRLPVQLSGVMDNPCFRSIIPVKVLRLHYSSC
ncbi:hypothetical protein BV22DRAFT_737644 [Leucogyrophana mollusca]|uniref:Uncharacterized protein n=1 Tax=Leucogyrophana mollusca TaxID=85980 RepID=A0ACB8B7U5_9AGAM|nr:hypothetical protein BV22DRAFT_737644 [Leucogyrophana mollusca]